MSDDEIVLVLAAPCYEEATVRQALAAARGEPFDDVVIDPPARSSDNAVEEGYLDVNPARGRGAG